MINKIGHINNISPSSNVKKMAKVSETQKSDSVSISAAGKAEAEKLHLISVIKDSPDIRMDKVEAAKARLAEYTKDGGMDDAVASGIYDRIIDGLLG